MKTSARRALLVLSALLALSTLSPRRAEAGPFYALGQLRDRAVIRMLEWDGNRREMKSQKRLAVWGLKRYLAEPQIASVRAASIARSKAQGFAFFRKGQIERTALRVSLTEMLKYPEMHLDQMRLD